ncbi:hypothetical protein PNOK_0473100 [Pyrrhoderma noxium]|uniref:Uncharacterized protein n=1 Tax=Pyrrhoderma noxium TaxID=2282107 RepID=A0A286UJM4_9AGAM|nr:hypothetical protein PNOK_0473100 [Pyrrhoderma noxium]
MMNGLDYALCMIDTIRIEGFCNSKGRPLEEYNFIESCSAEAFSVGFNLYYNNLYSRILSESVYGILELNYRSWHNMTPTIGRVARYTTHKPY